MFLGFKNVVKNIDSNLDAARYIHSIIKNRLRDGSMPFKTPFKRNISCNVSFISR